MKFLLGTTANSAPCMDENRSRKGEFAQFKEKDNYIMMNVHWHDGNLTKNSTILGKVARKLLCVPASSVQSQRIFFPAGVINSNLRSSLKPENADMLIF